MSGSDLIKNPRKRAMPVGYLSILQGFGNLTIRPRRTHGFAAPDCSGCAIVVQNSSKIGSEISANYTPQTPFCQDAILSLLKNYFVIPAKAGIYANDSKNITGFPGQDGE